MAGVLGQKPGRAPGPGARSWPAGRIIALVALLPVTWALAIHVVMLHLVWLDLGLLVVLGLVLGYAVRDASPHRHAALAAGGGALVVLGAYYGPIGGPTFIVVGSAACVTAAVAHVRERR